MMPGYLAGLLGALVILSFIGALVALVVFAPKVAAAVLIALPLILIGFVGWLLGELLWGRK